MTKASPSAAGALNRFRQADAIGKASFIIWLVSFLVMSILGLVAIQQSDGFERLLSIFATAWVILELIRGIRGITTPKPNQQRSNEP